LRISSFDGFAERAKSLIFRPQLLLLLLALSGVPGCGGGDDSGIGPIEIGSGKVQGFAGAVATDEPRATLIARDVLSGGGSAVDAAIAGYFALAVTLPSNAGIGGGGACLIHDAKAKKVDAVLFMPQAVPGGQFGVPASVRGMAYMQARYGRVPWATLVAPAENMALNGITVSRALAREIQTAGDKLRSDPELARIFVAPDGHLLREGDGLTQIELGSVLDQIRSRGGGDLYMGGVANRIAEAAEGAGIPLSRDMLRSAVPQVVQPVSFDYGSRALFFTPPPASGGLVGAELLKILHDAEDWDGTSSDVRPHLFVESSMRVFADRGRWLQPNGGTSILPASLLDDSHLKQLMASYSPDHATPASALQPPPPAAHPENPWAASLVVIDKDSNAVACNFTLNDLFGSGRVVPGTGIILAASPNVAGENAYNTGPMIWASRNNKSIYYLAAASGGVTAPTALAQVFLRTVADKQGLDNAIAAKRIHHNGEPDVVFYEEGVPQSLLQSLETRGHKLQKAGILGRVQAIYCPRALDEDSSTCLAAADPRGNGLSVVLQAQ
jgi:gamma-glutamyltranspeptidase / glutathione hydrolase